MSSSSDNPIPKGPPDLCFESGAFTKESFSVDQFLQDHRDKANLETMRDDLGIYLKVLRSAMIELINKDYADFVNLSSNLIGLDKAINSIQLPLGQLREELLQVRQSLDEAMTEVEHQLKCKKDFRVEKLGLRSLSRVQVALKKLKLMLAPVESGLPLEILTLERAISEFNQFQFHLMKCKKQITLEDQRMFESMEALMLKSVDHLFLESLSKGVSGKHDLACSLSFYLMLGKKEAAERLYRTRVVQPAMEPLISEETLRSLPRGLPGLYDKILSFVDKDMKHICEVTNSKPLKFPGLDSFDFVVRSFWPEVEMSLEVNLITIYAAGDPDMFYQRYCETLAFIQELGKRCSSASSVTELHSHPSFLSFMDKWDLTVYFQIRFQEVVKSIESAFENERGEIHSEEWKLVASETVWKCMSRCWQPGVFLLPVADKFWKLNLQAISRYHTWIGEVLSKKSSKSPSSLDFLVYLFCDIEYFVKKLPDFKEKAISKLPQLSSKMSHLLHQSIEESKEMLLNRLEDVNNLLIQCLNGKSNSVLRQVSDIPRLFRRTNRETPTKPCTYVTSLLESPTNFYKRHQKNHHIQNWLQTSLSEITKQYYNCVSEVLTSVQKTEESLRRLKKARDRSSNITSPNDKRAGDDDKIRLQLLLDMQAYVKGVEELGVHKAKVEKLDDMLLLVENTQKL